MPEEFDATWMCHLLVAEGITSWTEAFLTMSIDDVQMLLMAVEAVGQARRD